MNFYQTSYTDSLDHEDKTHFFVFRLVLNYGFSSLTRQGLIALKTSQRQKDAPSNAAQKSYLPNNSNSSVKPSFGQKTVFGSLLNK